MPIRFPAFRAASRMLVAVPWLLLSVAPARSAGRPQARPSALPPGSPPVAQGQIAAEAAAPARPAPGSYPQEAVVIERARTHFRFEADGTGSREFDVRLRIQSEAGVQQYGQLIFGYNSANERLEIAAVSVRKPDGTVVQTPAESVQDLSAPVQRVAPIYTDFRQKHVTVQSLRPGDTLEFSLVARVHTPLAPGQFWAEHDFQQDAIVLEEQLEMDVPAGQYVLLKTRPGFDPVVIEEAGRRTYRWTQAHLVREEDSPSKKEVSPAGSPKVAAVRLTTFRSWEAVGGWYAALEATQRMPTPEIRKKAVELTEGLTSDLAKLEALYTFAATNFRYVSLSLGAGRYQPRAAGDVLREQYGDCKDKHTLLASLAEAAGLQTSAVLMNSATKIDPDFPSPSQFDHVITRASAGGREIWLDTTTEVAPFELLALPLRNRQGLLVQRDAGSRLVTTPANPPMKSFASSDIDGTLDAGGRLEAHVRLVFRGDLELLMRTVFRNTPAAAWKKVLEEFTKADGAPGDVSNWKVADPASLKDPFAVDFDLTVPRFADLTTGRISIALPLTGTSDTAEVDTDDGEPMILGAAPTEVAYSLRLALPAGVSARAPLPVSLSRDYGAYTTTYSLEGNRLLARRLFTVTMSELPAARRQDYAAFARVVARDKKQLVALEATGPAAPAVGGLAGDGLKAGDLGRKGYDALQAGKFAEAVPLLKRTVELEPKDKVAWTNLGRAYLGLRDYEAAIAAFRRQIAVNPYDEFAYHYLGRAYLAQQKYPDAETAFLKQIEVNPLDSGTHAVLASLYLEQHQYDRALPWLDKATALTPDNAWLFAQLGKAYLHLDHEKAATEAFDRAVQLSPTPAMWNDIAYELALKGVQLARAQQYAESAVSATAAASRNIDVTRPDARAIAVVQSLTAHWDTLGWVHFARGDFARAERYVEAAWRMGQHPEVGDHLARIYEKQGRHAAALRMYALALAGERPAAEIREHFASLAGPSADLDALAAARRDELIALRTIRFDRSGGSDRRPAPGGGAQGGSAEFFVLFSPAKTVDGVHFVGGDEGLKGLADAIRTAPYEPMFPDETPARLLRRAAVACGASAGACTLTFHRVEDMQPER